MAQKGVQLSRNMFSCSICLDLLKDPVTIPCGHNYCMKCIKSHWNEEERRIHSCPQCSQTFTPRPALVKNTMLANLAEELKKTGLQAAPDDHCYAGSEDVPCDVCTGRKLKAFKSCLVCLVRDRENDTKVLQQEVEAINQSADKAVEDSEKIFAELIHLIQNRSSDVKQQIRSQQKTEVSRVKEFQEKLEQQITELKRKDAKLEQLSHTEDHNHFLRSNPSPLSESTDSSSIELRPLRYFEDVTAAVKEVRDKLQDTLREKWANISLTVTEVDVLLSQQEPKTRAGFLKYSCEIRMDPNTANTSLLLSEGNRKATVVKEQQLYSSHSDRFTEWCQVLSRESLIGSCYWEVEWSGEGVYIAVTYKNISRSGMSEECGLGFNRESWALRCDSNSYKFFHKKSRKSVSGPQSSRVGVYLNHSAGILSFYSVSETMTLLHRVQTTFTQPLHAGFRLLDYGVTAEFRQPKITEVM